jgi:glycosyltransferase involved in cell wall biosynthesis
VKLSIYTFVRNGLFYDFHVVEMLKHHVPFADEIIVNEGYSDDGTYDAIHRLDPKIKVFQTRWDRHSGLDYIRQVKNETRRRCTGDWCILLDCDEFIPEWEWDRIRVLLSRSDRLMHPVRLLNFYGNYRVYNDNPLRFRWPARKMLIHRNVPDIEVWGDGASVRQVGVALEWPPEEEDEPVFHHFGFVRHGARLREKWRNMRGQIYNGPAPRFRLPSFLFNLWPHNWKDPQFLPYLRLYEGPHIQPVRDNPGEFVRDKELLYRYLLARRQA